MIMEINISLLISVSQVLAKMYVVTDIIVRMCIF